MMMVGSGSLLGSTTVTLIKRFPRVSSANIFTPAALVKGTIPLRRVSSSSNNVDNAERIPVGIFIDLDNVCGYGVSHESTEALINPLRTFAGQIGDLQKFQAHSNSYTKSFVTRTEKARLKDKKVSAELIFQARRGEIDIPQNGIQGDIPWGGDISQTGIDSDGILRCGLCGREMADIGALHRHMSDWHDLERVIKEVKGKVKLKKRIRRHIRRQGVKRSDFLEKELQKEETHEVPQVGVCRIRPKNENDLIRVLREKCVDIKYSDNVDKSLISAAKGWMNSIAIKGGRVGKRDKRGCIVIVSHDADFSGVLDSAKSLQFLTVTVAPQAKRQTPGLKSSSDLVLTLPKDAVDSDGYLLRTFGHFIANPTSNIGEDVMEKIAKNQKLEKETPKLDKADWSRFQRYFD